MAYHEPNCLWCGAPLPPDTARRRFCSKRCGNAHSERHPGWGGIHRAAWLVNKGFAYYEAHADEIEARLQAEAEAEIVRLLHIND